jgi:heme exporter protein A
MLALLGTITRPSLGKVDFGELGLTRAAVRHEVGWVGHDSLCYPDLTGRQNIELAAGLHGRQPSAVVAQATARFELAAFVDRPVRTYSRGQRQRIALARALVHEPKLLLLDEPTTGLDVVGTERVKRAIREEAARGAVVVVVTHDEEFASSVAADVLTLERGRVANREQRAP